MVNLKSYIKALADAKGSDTLNCVVFAYWKHSCCAQHRHWQSSTTLCYLALESREPQTQSPDSCLFEAMLITWEVSFTPIADCQTGPQEDLWVQRRISTKQNNEFGEFWIEMSCNKPYQYQGPGGAKGKKKSSKVNCHPTTDNQYSLQRTDKKVNTCSLLTVQTLH